MIHVALSAIWEVWRWSSSEVTFFGVALLLFGAYALGFATGRFPEDGRFRNLPGWVQFGFLAAVIGLVLVIGANAAPCEPGECDRPGP